MAPEPGILERADGAAQSASAGPLRLFVELTTECNLRCAMCVKQSSDGSVCEGSLTPELFESLTPAFPSLDALVLNGIGESLLHPDLESFIRQAKRSLPARGWVGFQTNGMLLTETRAASLVDAGLDRICLSLDTVSQEEFHRIREGGVVSGVEAAFTALGKARRGNGGGTLQAGFEFVLRRDNLRDLPGTIAWAARKGATFALISHLLPYDRSLVGQSAYDTNTAAAIALYEKWRAKGHRTGLDIGRYFEIFMKVTRSADEQRLLDLVKAMMADAEKGGITLHLERLLRRDEAWFREVEEVFSEARIVAEQEGLDLKLPATAPCNTRKCEFVEGGGAFVSWNGDVHPCYFLWHRYRCYVGGWEKHVRPWTFGNLREHDILSLWSGESYRAFRANVLRYRFPFCFDCSFALCDYVQGEEFEQDCYLEDVPCGACLWCTGLFQCLQ